MDVFVFSSLFFLLPSFPIVKEQMMWRLWMVSGCILILIGCKAERDPSSLFGPDDSGLLVVDALLIVDKPLPAMYVRQTLGLGEAYSWSRAAVRDAEVVIEGGGQRVVYRYEGGWTPVFGGFEEHSGRYVPSDDPPLVLPETTYHLTVRSQGREARAVTTTPGRIGIRDAVLLDEKTLTVTRQLKTFRDGGVYAENRLIYQEGLFEARFGPLPVKGYQVGIQSLDLNSELLLDTDLVDEEDLTRYGSSPAFEAKDGTLRLPWFAIYYAGRHVIRIFAVDENWFDLIRSVPEFFQGGDGAAFQPGGLAGDNFERPLFRVEGGIGIFGSASMDSLGFVVLPKE